MIVALLLADAATMSPELARSVAAYHRATMAKDVGTLSRLTAPDYFLVNSDASTQDKASYLSDFQTADFRIAPYVVTNPVVRLMGDSAVIGGEMKLSWSIGGRSEARNLRFAHWWVVDRGHWLLKYSQLTRIPERPSQTSK